MADELLIKHDYYLNKLDVTDHLNLMFWCNI